jgi:hypothetical protein
MIPPIGTKKGKNIGFIFKGHQLIGSQIDAFDYAVVC